ARCAGPRSTSAATTSTTAASAKGGVSGARGRCSGRSARASTSGRSRRKPPPDCRSGVLEPLQQRARCRHRLLVRETPARRTARPEVLLLVRGLGRDRTPQPGDTLLVRFRGLLGREHATELVVDVGELRLEHRRKRLLLLALADHLRQRRGGGRVRIAVAQ